MLSNIYYFLNLENTLIPRTFFPQLMSSGKFSYYRAIQTMDKRITLTAPAKDWLIMRRACPRIIEKINNRGIKIIPTLFSHMLPDIFPEAVKSQMEYSHVICKNLFDRLGKVGIIPENNVSSFLVKEVSKWWSGIILSISHNEKAYIIPGHKKLMYCGLELPLLVVSNTEGRMAYLKMFREHSSVHETIAAMGINSSINDYSHAIYRSCLFDFERPWSNVIIHEDGKIGVPRVDIWKQFHSAISKEEILDTAHLDSIGNFSGQNITIDKNDLRMWASQESFWLIDIQRETLLNNLGRGDYFELASLVAASCMPPRVLTRFMSNDSFEASFRNQSGIVYMVGDISKVKELLFICKNIKYRRRISYGSSFLPEGERLYLEMLDEALSEFI